MLTITSENLNKLFRSRHPEVFSKKCVLENFAKNNRKTLVPEYFLIKFQAQACNFIKKQPLVQVFSCGFCKIFKNTFLLNTSGRLLLAISEPFFMATCVSFYNTAGNLDVYTMFQGFSSLDSGKF